MYRELRVLDRRLIGMFLMAWGVLWGLPGCARPPQPEYALQKKTEELPQNHQQQIQANLERLFGSPVKPRFLGPSSKEVAEGAEPELAAWGNESRLALGSAIFQERCAGCHGPTGDGAGESAQYLTPKPRDYRSGIFKFTSTPYGSKPSHQDLVRFLRKGAKGTSMPGFPFLPDDELNAVVEYVIMLAHRGELEQKVAAIAAVDLEPDQELKLIDFTDSLKLIHSQWGDAKHQVVLPLTPQPPMTDETIVKGRQAFVTKGCSKCHGEDGRGQTDWLSSEFIAQQQALPESQRPQINFDSWGNVAPAADLTAGMLHGGRRRIDIYRRIHNGINGTPMPAFAQALAAEPDTIWHLVHYINSVVEGRPLPPMPPAAETATTPAAPSE